MRERLRIIKFYSLLIDLRFRMFDFSRKLWMFVGPAIILVGTVGNVLTLFTITNRRIRKNSFDVYLGALAIADTASLYVSTLNSWLFFGFDIDIMLTTISCKILGFLHHVCMMWSSLLVAALSTDKMLCICFPQKREQLSTPKSAMIVISFSLCFVIMINVHELYGFTLIAVKNATVCGYIDTSYSTFYDVYFTWVDTSVYLILPTIVIIVTNILTVRVVINSTKRVRHAMNIPAARNRIRNQRQMIFMAVAVSVAFLLLTSPFGILTIIRPYVFNASEVFYPKSNIEIIVTTITAILASLNSAINFFLYFISGSRFREDLKAACCCGRSSSVAPIS